MKSLPVRSTRGKRISELIGEEKDLDEVFWGQPAFKDDEVDEEYVTESEAEDVFDADFFKAESSGEEEVVEIEQVKVKGVSERRKKRRRLAVSMKMFMQEQMLEEAAVTELMNLHSLKEAAGLADSTDHLNLRKRRVLLPPVEKFISKGKSPALFTFASIPEFPKPSLTPKRSGKYLDPLTGCRYSTTSEFAALRAQVLSPRK